MIRTLAKSIREYKKPSILAPVFVTGEVIMECIIPFIIANLVNEIKAGISMPVLLGYGGVLILMAGLSLAFGALAGKACSTASCGFARNLRKDMFYKIQGYSFENIDKFSVSSLVTRLTTDITNVQMAYMMIIRTAVRSPLMLIFSFAMGFIMGGKMAFIFLFTIPVLGIGLFLVTKKTMPLFRRVFRKYDALNASVQENIRGMRVVKAYVREDYEKKKFDRAAEDVQKDFTKAERILAINNPLMQFCIYVVMIFVMSFGSYTVITSQGLDLDVGQMSSLLTYSFQILMSLMMVSMIFVMVTMSLESAERIVEVLSEESTLQNPQNPVMEVKDGSIDFDQVSFKYSKKATRNALSHIDLHIKSGEIIGILGGTGSSKTSLIQLIPRLYDATENRYTYSGVDVRTTIWRPCATRWPWCCKRTSCSPAPSRRTCAGATPTPPTSSWKRPAASPRQTSLSSSSLKSMTPTSSRAAPTCPAARSSAFALPGLAEEAQDFDFGRLHQRRGYPHRRPHPPGLPQVYPRDHQDHHCPAGGLCAGRRPHYFDE